jgi:hypothetical protein
VARELFKAYFGKTEDTAGVTATAPAPATPPQGGPVVLPISTKGVKPAVPAVPAVEEAYD